MGDWEQLEKNWWRKVLRPGTAVVICVPELERKNDFHASVFIDGAKVLESSSTSLSEAKKWGEAALFSAFTAATK